MQKEARGFTLIEVIVSLTLLALLAVALFGSLRMAINAWSKGEEKIGEWVKFRIAGERIRKQLACVYPIMLQTQTGEIRGQYVPYLRGTSSSVEFVSLSSLNFQQHPGLTIVSYQIKDFDGRPWLVETERPYLGQDSVRPDTLNAAVSYYNPIGTDLPLFSDVEALEFRYLEKIDDGTAPPTSEWVPEWDSDLKKDMPAAVEMRVAFRDTGNHKVFPRLREQRLLVELLAKPLTPSARYLMRRQQRLPGVPGVGPGPGGIQRGGPRFGPGGGPPLPPRPPRGPRGRAVP